MITFVTQPVCLVGAFGGVIMRRALVLCCVPVQGSQRAFAGKRVVGANSLTTTERAPSAIATTAYSYFPCLQVPIGTLSAGPTHFAAVFRRHDNAAKVSILSMVPLVLQLRNELTDVWPSLLLLLSWQCTAVCAAAVVSCC